MARSISRKAGSPRHKGPEGGAADEAGGQYRRSVAALFVAHGLNGLPLQGLPFGTPRTVRAVGLETAFPIDDVTVGLSRGKLYIQAKRTLSFGRPMKEVIGQWLRAARSSEFDQSLDYMAAATGNASGTVRDLARYLNRRRGGASTYSAGELEALDNVRTSLSKEGATEAETELILSRAMVLQLDTEASENEHAERGRLLLDGHVVTKGQGARAWRELLAIAGETARLRLDRSIETWLDLLRNTGVDLVADANASNAAQIARTEQALGHYLELLRRKGEWVDLTAIGVPIPSIRFSELDAEVLVKEPDGDEREKRELLWAFRLRGRVVLTGLPGGGKSTALTALAANWSRHPHWAIPIHVSLRRIAEKERFRKRPLLEDILDTATEDLLPIDRASVRESLDTALRTGQAVLFLDGLDEAANRSLDVASDLARLLKDCHPDTDVLLTTRDVAYADASILKFSDLRLCAPGNTRRLVQKVLESIAAHRQKGVTDEWLQPRIAWIDELLKRDRQLAETPLMPVLLAVLAADSPTNDLPTSRSLILSRVVHDFVRRKEVARLLEVTGIPGGQAADAVLGAFPVIASAIADAGGSAPHSFLSDNLALYIKEEWGLPLAAARSTASQILVVWDESGMCVASGADRLTSPRLQLFLEIGAAMSASSMSRNQLAHWIDEPKSGKHSKETLVLAAGLSSQVAETLVEHSFRERNAKGDLLALAVAEALPQGAAVSEFHLRQLVDRLGPLLDVGDNRTWILAGWLLRASFPPELQNVIMSKLRASLPPSHFSVAESVAVVEWNWAPERRLEVLERVLRVPKIGGIKRSDTGELVISSSPFADRIYMRALEEAATAVLPQRPDLAPAVSEAIKHSSSRTAQVLRNLLVQCGHGHFTDSYDRSLYKAFEGAANFASSIRDTDKAIDDTLQVIADLAPPSKISSEQSRRLAEIRSLVETLNLNYDSYLIGNRLEPLRKSWIGLITKLGKFDAGVLAAQASIVLTEEAFEGKERRLFYRLFDAAKPAELDGWTNVENPVAARDLLLTVLDGPRDSAIVAVNALVTHPDREGTRIAIRNSLSRLPRESARMAVQALLELAESPSEAAADLARWDVNAVREAVAEFGPLVDAGRPNELGVLLAKDPVRQVQLAAIERLGDLSGTQPTSELIELLREVVASPSSEFVCDRCDALNSTERESCESCHTSVVKPSSRAAAILSSLGG